MLKWFDDILKQNLMTEAAHKQFKTKNYNLMIQEQLEIT